MMMVTLHVNKYLLTKEGLTLSQRDSAFVPSDVGCHNWKVRELCVEMKSSRIKRAMDPENKYDKIGDGETDSPIGCSADCAIDAVRHCISLCLNLNTHPPHFPVPHVTCHISLHIWHKSILHPDEGASPLYQFKFKGTTFFIISACTNIRSCSILSLFTTPCTKDKGMLSCMIILSYISFIYRTYVCYP